MRGILSIPTRHPFNVLFPLREKGIVLSEGMGVVALSRWFSLLGKRMRFR